LFFPVPPLLPRAPPPEQWDLNIKREIAKNTILDIAYVGRRAYHLPGLYNVDQDQIYTNGFLDAFKTIKAGGESSPGQQSSERGYPAEAG
jgi:hypothetical protein